MDSIYNVVKNIGNGVMVAGLAAYMTSSSPIYAQDNNPSKIEKLIPNYFDLISNPNDEIVAAGLEEAALKLVRSKTHKTLFYTNNLGKLAFGANFDADGDGVYEVTVAFNASEIIGALADIVDGLQFKGVYQLDPSLKNDFTCDDGCEITTAFFDPEGDNIMRTVVGNDRELSYDEDQKPKLKNNSMGVEERGA